MKYGYMDHHHNDGRSAQLLSADGLKNYIMDFQGFAGLNQVCSQKNHIRLDDTYMV